MAEPAQIRPMSEEETAQTIQPRVVLQPLAAPSILGLFGFAGATLIVAANMAGWYGDSTTPFYLAPFALAFGGIAQFMAGMWSYKARDAVATAMHGMWGAFWIGYGILFLLIGTGVLPDTGLDPALGFWFIALAAITFSGAFAALSESAAVFGVLLTLATGAAIAAGALLSGVHLWEVVAGWVFVVSAVMAWYTATAMMLEAAAGKVILPLFKYKRDTNIPGRKPTRPIELAWAEPGIRKGQ